MEQEVKVNAKEIMERLTKLQEDLDFVKRHIPFEDDLFKKEMEAWERASEEDNINWDKENLEDG